MKLSEKLKKRKFRTDDIEPLKGRLDPKIYDEIKSMVHFRLVKELDLASISEMPRKELSHHIKASLQHITSAEMLPLNRDERTALVSDLMNEILGLGPIESLMQDSSVQDILVNGYSKVYVEKKGLLHLTPIQFRDNEHLMQIIDKIVSGVNRRIDESSPMVDARLSDGSRVNVIIPPLALNGPVLSIRKFRHAFLSMDEILHGLTLTPEIKEYLKAAVHSKLNLLISGGTGAGKTTFLNILSGYVPETERIITIEDSAELRLHQPHVVRLESRPSNIEEKGEVTLTDLVRNSLRMRPDRIIVGETRGAEVMDMLQAMNTGHPGSMSTIHANSPRDAFSRMEIMLSMASSMFSVMAMKGFISSAINIVVQLARLPDGKRRVISISEIMGIEGNEYKMQNIFEFVQKGIDEQGNIYGFFAATGAESCYYSHMRSHGCQLSKDIFKTKKEVR